MDCPYCQSKKVFYSRSPMLNAVRMMTSSNKRYCANCKKKWRSRPRGRAKDYSFYAVALPLVLLFSFGMFKMTDRPPVIGSSSVSASPQAMFSKKGAAGLVPAIPSSMMTGDMKDKLEKLKKNPKLISKLSGEKKAMAEKALAMMKK